MSGAIVDDAGNELPTGEVGQIAPAARSGDVARVLEQPGGHPGQVRRRLAADRGSRCARRDSRFWYRSRADDVITSAGYRIGPGEIEEALLRHPAVRLAAAIGVPDAVRTESIKAFLVLAEDQQPTDALAQEIREFVKTRLARHSIRHRVRRQPADDPPARSCGGNCVSGNGRGRRQGTSRRAVDGRELTCRGSRPRFLRIPPPPASGSNTRCARLRATIPVARATSRS